MRSSFGCDKLNVNIVMTDFHEDMKTMIFVRTTEHMFKKYIVEKKHRQQFNKTTVVVFDWEHWNWDLIVNKHWFIESNNSVFHTTVSSTWRSTSPVSSGPMHPFCDKSAPQHNQHHNNY